MQIKGFFSNSSPFFQLGVLLYFVLIGILLNSAITHAVVYITGLFSGSRPETGSFANMPFYTIQTAQFFSGILIFILPALSTAYFCSNKPYEFLQIKRRVTLKVILLSAIMLFFIAPFIELTSNLNSKIHLPELLAPLADWMQKTEEQAAGITEKTLSEKGFFAFATNIFIIGVMAGVAEEFFFRGALMSIITKKIKNHHMTIWLIAIIFSIIHFQFSGFIPRVILGAFLGYLLFWTKNIWVPVFAHALNNIMAIAGYKLGLYQLSRESTVLTSSSENDSDFYVTLTIAIVGLALFLFCAKKMKRVTDSG